MEHKKKLKCELYNDSMQGWKCYPIQKAQLIIADVPYNVGTNFYGSNPMWYEKGDNKNGESKLAGKAAFASDFNFNLYEYFHFCSRLMKKEPKKAGARGRSSDAPCMIVFCSFEQTHTLIKAAEKHGFIHYIPLVFVKNYSPQVLKANMRVVGATEYALVFYRDKLPKFRNLSLFSSLLSPLRYLSFFFSFSFPSAFPLHLRPFLPHILPHILQSIAQGCPLRASLQNAERNTP